MKGWPARSGRRAGRRAGTQSERTCSMFKRKGRHRKPRVGPVLAVQLALWQLSGVRELDAVAAAQLAELAGS